MFATQVDPSARAALARLRAAVTDLQGADLTGCADGEVLDLLRELETETRRLPTVQHALIAQAGGSAYTQVDGRIIKSTTADSLTDWNAVEVVVTGTDSAHIVNGQVVARMRLLSFEVPTIVMVWLPVFGSLGALKR